MKRPYLNMEQRKQIRLNTMYGAGLKVNLAQTQLLHSIRKEQGCFAAWKAGRELNKAYKLLTPSYKTN